MTRRVALELSMEEAEALKAVIEEWMEFNREIPDEDEPGLPAMRERVSRVLGRLLEAMGGVAEPR